MPPAWRPSEMTQAHEALVGPPSGPSPASPRGQSPAGLADFRGLPLTRIEGITLTDADFTAARAPRNAFGVAQSAQVRRVLAERVTFDGAGPFYRLEGQFHACTFRRIRTTSCSVTGTFTDCDFTGARFAGAHVDARFVRCRFTDCDLRLASWGGTFEACVFTGSKIHELFSDIRAITSAADPVSFTVTPTGVHRIGD